MSVQDSASALDPLRLPEMIAHLAAGKASGVLDAASGDTRRSMVLEAGEVVIIRSSSESEMLGSWLVEQGRISDGLRALVLFQQGGQSGAPPLGELLVARKALTVDELETELVSLALETVARAATQPATRLDFTDHPPGSHVRVLPRLSTRQVILAAARVQEDTEHMRRGLGAFEQTVSLADELDILMTELMLSPTEGFLLSRLGTPTTLADLLRASSLPEDQTLATLYALKLAGIITTNEAVQDTNQPSEGHRRNVLAVDEQKLSEAQREERQRIKKLATELPHMDHYRALGLHRDATHDQVVRAFDDLEARYSEERLTQAHLRDLVREFDLILERAREAHEVLSNPKSRRRYDPILDSVEQERAGLLLRPTRGDTDAGARKEIVEANFKRASELVREGEIYLAIQLLEQACTLEPRPVELLNLARLLLRNPLWSNRALNHIRRATEIDPSLIEAWIELAEFWRRRNNPDMQRKALEKALSVDPEHERASKMFRLLAGKRELERVKRRLRMRQS